MKNSYYIQYFYYNKFSKLYHEQLSSNGIYPLDGRLNLNNMINIGRTGYKNNDLRVMFEIRYGTFTNYIVKYSEKLPEHLLTII